MLQTTQEIQIEQLTKQLDEAKTLNLHRQKDIALILAIAGKPLPKNGLPSEINILTAKQLIEQEMAKHNLVIEFDETGHETFKQRISDELSIDYFLDNKKVGLSDYIDATLTEMKFIAGKEGNKNLDQDIVNNVVYQLANQRVPTNPALANPTIAAEVAAQLKELSLL